MSRGQVSIGVLGLAQAGLVRLFLFAVHSHHGDAEPCHGLMAVSVLLFRQPVSPCIDLAVDYIQCSQDVVILYHLATSASTRAIRAISGGAAIIPGNRGKLIERKAPTKLK
jgi:hypothetical protein